MGPFSGTRLGHVYSKKNNRWIGHERPEASLADSALQLGVHRRLPAWSCAARAPPSSSSHTVASILFLGADAAPGSSAAPQGASQAATRACSGRSGASGRSSGTTSAGRRGGPWGQRRRLLEDNDTAGKIRRGLPSMDRLLQPRPPPPHQGTSPTP